MSSDNVISAVFAEMAMVKTRGVMKLILEIPLEQAERALQILGIPQPGSEKWVAVVPLIDGSVQQKPANAPGGEKALRQCQMLCKDERFQDWIVNHPDFGSRSGELTEANARSCVLDACSISTRADLNTNAAAVDRWNELVDDFRRENGVKE